MIYIENLVLWIMWILFLNLIPVLVVATLEKKKLCVECQNAIPAKALVCSYCGLDIRERRRSLARENTSIREDI